VLTLLCLACRRAEAVSGLPVNSHQLLHNGQVLSGKSLAEYGVQKGSVLELVPYEPFPQESLPVGSPPLSSPEHELVRGPLRWFHFKSVLQWAAQHSTDVLVMLFQMRFGKSLHHGGLGFSEWAHALAV
jgi:hypothetical protein